MTVTVVETGHPVDQTARAEPKSKLRFRPKSLLLPDPREITRKLSMAMGSDDKKRDDGKDKKSDDKKDDDTASTSTLWKEEYTVDSNNASYFPPSPRTVDPNSKPKYNPALSPGVSSQQSSSASPRRSSLFSHFSFKGSNYDPKEDEPTPPTPRYKHVPKNAASQFAKTTTVEPLADKSAANRQMLPSPPPVKGTMSVHEYNRMYRRTQSLSAGRTHERTNSLFPPVLESTAEVEEEPLTSNPRHSLQPHHMRGFNLAHELTRRMSAGNIQAKADVQRIVDMPTSPRRSSFSDGRHQSIASSGSDSNSPFRQDFNNMSRRDSRRDSETGSTVSRRGSLNPQRATAIDMYRVDWSQSDEPKSRRDSKWSLMKGRIGHGSQSREGSVSGHEDSHNLPSPKSGFLARFRR